MMKRDKCVEQGFYEECAKLLGIDDYVYKPFPFSKKTRWNNRAPGNGRFEGHGLIRMFGDNAIVVSLNRPRLTGTFKTTDDVLAALRAALENTHE